MANVVSDDRDYPLPPLNCIIFFSENGRDGYFGIAFVQVIVELYTVILRKYFFLGITHLSKGDLRWFRGDLT